MSRERWRQCAISKKKVATLTSTGDRGENSRLETYGRMDLKNDA